MKRIAFITAFAVVAIASASVCLAAQPGVTLNVKMMTFNMWCQDTQRYAFERCEERRADDLRDFELYRQTVENYEVDYLKDREKDEALRQRVVNPDFGSPDTTRIPGGNWPN